MSSYSSKAKVLERAKLEREKLKMIQEKRKNNHSNHNNHNDGCDLDFMKVLKTELMENKNK